MEQINNIRSSRSDKTERTLSDILAAHQSNAVSDGPLFVFEKVLDWDVETVTRLQQTSIELSQLIQSETLPWKDNPFRFVQKHDAAFMEDNRIFESLRRLTDQVNVLQKVLEDQKREVGCSFDGTIGGIATLLSSLEYLVSRPV